MTCQADVLHTARRALTQRLAGMAWARAQVLMRRSKNNPLLLGDAGVGKTALVEGLAQLLASDQAPPGCVCVCVREENIGPTCLCRCCTRCWGVPQEERLWLWSAMPCECKQRH